MWTPARIEPPIDNRGKTVRVIWSETSTPAWNMALDEALLLSDASLTLRFYQWSPFALSLGRFQAADDELMKHHGDRGYEVVRRLTGGGAIFHAHELTYSLTGTDGTGPFQGGVSSSYRLFHEAIIDALETTGIRCSFAEERDAPSALKRSQQPFLCFSRCTSMDLVDSRGLKLVGSAKRRVRGRALQHGSILLAPHSENGMSGSLVSQDGTPNVADLAKKLAGNLAERLSQPLSPGTFTPRELETATKLLAKYSGQNWTVHGLAVTPDHAPEIRSPSRSV